MSGRTVSDGVNDSRRPDPRKEACEALAERYATDEGLREARRAELGRRGTGPAGAGTVPGIELPPTGTPPPAEPPASGTSPPVEPTLGGVEEVPRPISIWKPRDEEGERVFVRPPPLPLGDHHATRLRIPAAKPAGVRRIAFFGESAAAGYLYAPRHTPAGVLQAQLAAASAGGAGPPAATGFEVIDLARTNETLAGLAATVESALQLAPDAMVVFAGNNWNLLETPEVSPWSPAVADRLRYAEALAEGGLAGPVALARRELERKVEAAFARVAAAARAAREGGVPVVLVVPEVNLADWESRQPVPWLPGDGTPRWWRLYEEAAAEAAALGIGAGGPEGARGPVGAGGAVGGSAGEGDEGAAGTEQPGRLAGLAEQMATLDGGSLGTADRLLARAAAAVGDLAEARRYAEAEIDHTPYATLAFLDAPRAGGLARDLLGRVAGRHGFAVVDLPRTFAEHTGDPLPGRRLFLDYCHLTAEGIAVAMAAVAAAVVAAVDRREVPWQSLVAAAPPAPPVAAEVEATARLGAAVHGAHRLLTVDGPRPILRHWLREALAASPGVAAAMLDLVAARAAPCPAVLTAAQERNVASQYRLLLQHGWRWDFLDAELVEAICDVLAEAGRPVRREVEDLFVAGHAPGPEGIELSRPPYLWEPLERFYPEAMSFADLDGHGLHRAAWPWSRFCLVADGAGSVALDLTARLPAIEGFAGARQGELELLVNGRRAGRIAVGERWSRRRLELGPATLRRGFNRIEIAWPPLPPVGDAALAAARRRLEMGLEASLHPVFGEVASLRAVAAPG